MSAEFVGTGDDDPDHHILRGASEDAWLRTDLTVTLEDVR
jgi:hypothetical protein